jgi:hypothetical protein
MNEREWLCSTDLEAMLAQAGSALDARKVRLFACGCCRLVWPLLRDPAWRRMVEISEQFAQGQVSARELAHAWRKGWSASSAASANSAALLTGSKTVEPGQVAYLVQRASWWHACRRLGPGPPWTADQSAAGEEARHSAERQQCRLLREIVGNPFRQPRIDPLWCEANGAAVRQLATLIDRERDFSYLPILADALEEAGCSDAGLLEHCRQRDGHVLGCWAVDLCLHLA